ncbi:hypothetical protein O181_001950 [Austropuccinia psidii MF-1]|uniref:Reverse transcriptase Ty1/copia-type domain-containing protein n=1 Tax=Austropuccinia psidii MF-1 TaxID=1389203 RepID=A0A9Q3GCC8_9BASI|nr:hypothetical protein [Austropuccinia psidii MF-1]
MSWIVGLEHTFGKAEVNISQRCFMDGIIDTYPRKVVHCDSPLPVLAARQPDGSSPFLGPLGALRSSGRISPQDKGPLLVRHPGNLSLNLWSGTGWVEDLERSQLGFIPKLGDAPILWGSKQQSFVVLSTCATKYVVLLSLTQHMVQAINQLTQISWNFDK